MALDLIQSNKTKKATKLLTFFQHGSRMYILFTTSIYGLFLPLVLYESLLNYFKESPLCE